MARRAENDDIRVLPGNALDQRTLENAGIKEASTLLIALHEGFEAGAIFQRAQELNPALRVISRGHSDSEVQPFERLGEIGSSARSDRVCKCVSLTGVPGSIKKK